MKRSASRRVRLLPLLLALVLCCCDGGAAFLLVTSDSPVRIAALCFHVMAAALFPVALSLLRPHPQKFDVNRRIISAGTALFIPAYGMAGVLFLYLFLTPPVQAERFDHLRIDYEQLPDKLNKLLKDFDGDIFGVMHGETAIESFQDIFLSEDTKLEENVISKLGKIGNKNTVTILQSVLKRSRTDSRILAASALIELEEKTVKRIERLEQKLNNGDNSAELLLSLAQTYDLYCHLGVLDGTVIDHYRNTSIDYYDRYLGRRPQDTVARVEFGRMMLKSGDYEIAAETFQRIIKEKPGVSNPHLWLAESYFEMRDFDGVRRVCAGLAEMENVPEVLKEVVNWWAVDAFVVQMLRGTATDG